MSKFDGLELTSFQKELAIIQRTTPIYAPVGHVRPIGEGLQYGGKQVGDFELWHAPRDTFILDEPADETEFAGKQHEKKPWLERLPYYHNARNLPDEVADMMGKGLAQLPHPPADFLAGIPNAGTKLAQAFARYSQVPIIEVFAKATSESGRQIISNGVTPPPGLNRLLIADNAIASGASLFEAIRAARSMGWRVVGALEVFDREELGFYLLERDFPDVVGLSVLQCRPTFEFLRGENLVSEQTPENIQRYLSRIDHLKQRLRLA